MRLTLRTMLAYLDDILEPDDTEDIGKKIEESEFATNLVHRVRDCMRRLRLGVPALIGRGLAADPNSVAEYLDNKLAADRVPEFEKVCLESDVHLAEVASCHQILTLVLGEPAEIDSGARQRMYQLSAYADAPPVQQDAPQGVMGATAGTATTAEPRRRARPEVPEYLRETRRRWWPVAAVVALAALLTFALLAALDPNGVRGRALALLGGSSNAADADTADDAGAANARQPADESAKTDEADDESSTEHRPGEGVADGAADMPARDPGDDSSTAAAPAGDDAASLPSSDTPPIPAVGDEQPPAGADQEEMTVEADKPPLPDDSPAPVPVADHMPIPDDDDPPATAAPAGDAPAGEAAEGADSIGRFTSKQDLLLKLDPVTKTWLRLPAMAPLAKGDRLISLPAFRPTIALSSNITIHADGAARFELTGWTSEGVPILTVEEGRLWMLTVGKAGNALVLSVGGQQALITFVDAESMAAVEVKHVLPPGRDPESGPATATCWLFATSGLIRVREQDSSTELQAPTQRLLFVGEAERAAAASEMPKWITSESIPESDRQAATRIAPLFQVGKPLGMTLKELSGHRQREIRALAIRDSCLLGDFDACVQALGDANEKNAWNTYVDELRAAVARDPETAAAVRATLEKLRSTDAKALYRMLWGYSGEDLKNGADRDLVDALNHEAVDMRVLAFWNLQNVTGLPSSGYRPGDLEKQRRAAINSWKEKLRQNKIVPKGTASSTKTKPTTKAAEKDRS